MYEWFASLNLISNVCNSLAAKSSHAKQEQTMNAKKRAIVGAHSVPDSQYEFLTLPVLLMTINNSHPYSWLMSPALNNLLTSRSACIVD